VLSATGEKTSSSGDSAIGNVSLTTTKAPGADDIDLEEVTLQWVDNDGTYNIIHADSTSTGGEDGFFTVSAIKDDDGSSAVINSPDDRINIDLDIGTADGNHAAGPNDLDEGETATLRITTSSGTATTERLVVPESLSGTTATNL
jgi:archaellin